ncbi:MAG TPA: FAD-binding oxidoreductase [Usitatibacter sp.]|jgi:sarcosine oxidase subunit beta|nr:FAD-binding oxidoreductase [Usitatibacter sp.]
MATADVVVIGGGLHGCSAALHLARAGASVVVLEKDHVARHASGVNAGGVRRLGRDFAEVPLSVASLELWNRIEELVDDPCGFERVGQVKVAEDEAALQSMRERSETLRRSGFTHEEVIGRDELREWLPAVAPHCVGGVVCRDDGAALPFRTTLAFRRKAESLGVRFHEGICAQAFERSGGAWRVWSPHGTFEGGALVNAAGAWAGEIARQLGEPVPMAATALMLMITAPVAPFVKPVVGVQGRPLSFKQYANGTIMIGGGQRGRADLATNRTSLDYARLAFNARTAADLFPRLRHAQIVRAWAGIEGMMPDGIPVIGPSCTQERAWHAFGFSAHGFQLGPIVGSIIADLVTRGATGLPITPFSIARFTPGAA